MKYSKGLIFMLLATTFSVATAQMPERVEKTINMVDRITGSVISGVDIGRFQAGEDNVVIVPDAAMKDTVVCRFRSAAGNCYRLSVNDGQGSVPVPLIDSGAFSNFLAAFRARPNWEACEIIDSPWGEWEVVGEIPTAEGTHTYTERRLCSTGGIAEACPDTCLEASQDRTLTITNEVECVDTSWVPVPSSHFEDEQYWQTSNCGNTRLSWGSWPREGGGGCTDTSWSPDTDWYAAGTSFIQSSNCGNSRAATGTYVSVIPEPEPPALPQCDANFDLGGMNPADYYVDQCATFYNGCGDSTTMCGSMSYPEPEIIETEQTPTPEQTCVTIPGMWGTVENYYDDPGNGLVWIPEQTICY
ncbi:MAG: hypothetical protein Q8K97_17795 [Pseudohongiella sp.]|nr:hypothetical protein [Pseudohongiella sp.]